MEPALQMRALDAPRDGLRHTHMVAALPCVGNCYVVVVLAKRGKKNKLQFVGSSQKPTHR